MSFFDENSQKYREVSRKSQVPKKRQKMRRVEGDFLWYFLLHNLFSVFLFSFLGSILGLFDYNFLYLIGIFSLLFVEVFFRVTVLAFITGLFGRITAYITLKVIYDWRKLAPKKIGEYNRGINKITSFSYLISIVLSSLIFTLGIFPIIESRIFGESTITTVMLTYLIIKIAIFIIVRGISQFKL
jgi:hypothetical protein